MIDLEQMLSRQIIDPLDDHTFTAARFNSRARRRATIAPHCGWRQVAVDLALFDLAHREPDSEEPDRSNCTLRYGRQRQRIEKLRQPLSIESRTFCARGGDKTRRRAQELCTPCDWKHYLTPSRRMLTTVEATTHP